MGGVQAKEEAEVEVHSVRGGQLILKVAPQATRSTPSSSSSTPSGGGSEKGGGGGGGIGSSSGAGGGAVYHAPLVKRESRLSLIIPLQGKCYIVDQSMDVLEKVFQYLTPRELAFLSLTSRGMHLMVSQFLQHSTHLIRPRLRTFYEEQSELLLPKEEVLRQRMECNFRHDLLLYSARRQFEGKVRRVSFAKILDFGGLRDEDNTRVVQERDVSLKRDCVVVRGLTGLRFRHVFPDVPPGRHVLRMRLRLSHAPWGREIAPQCPTIVTVSRLHLRRPSCRHHRGDKSSTDGADAPLTPSSFAPESRVASRTCLVSQPVAPQTWARIRDHADDADRQYPLDLGRASLHFERDSDWFFVVMEEFITKEDAVHVEVAFDDTANPNCRKSCVWDLIELRSFPLPKHLVRKPSRIGQQQQQQQRS